jgi:hypothetical protein
MRVWVLQRSLCRGISRLSRFCQHQVRSSDCSVPFLSRCFYSIALYGLILFYGLTKDELAGNRPLAKFLSIKLIVMFTFYQSFVVSRTFSVSPFSRSFVAFKFNALKGRVIHGTEFWTATNVADGLDALTTCIEAWDPFFPGFVLPG